HRPCSDAGLRRRMTGALHTPPPASRYTTVSMVLACSVPRFGRTNSKMTTTTMTTVGHDGGKCRVPGFAFTVLLQLTHGQGGGCRGPRTAQLPRSTSASAGSSETGPDSNQTAG